MARKEIFRARLNTQEMEKLERHARRRGISSAEFFRDYLKRLPSLEGDELQDSTRQPVAVGGIG